MAADGNDDDPFHLRDVDLRLLEIARVLVRFDYLASFDLHQLPSASMAER
jgi:hypothetical protein